MEEEKWYSVSEIAELSGVTSQAVYKRLATSLSTFVKVEKGRKLVSSRAIELLNQPTVKQQPTNQAPTVESAEILATLNRTIEILQQQLATKDQQIENLDKRLEQALRNSSESHFVLAQHQQKAIEGATNGFNIPWYKRLFKSRKTVVEGVNDIGEV